MNLTKASVVTSDVVMYVPITRVRIREKSHRGARSPTLPIRIKMKVYIGGNDALTFSIPGFQFWPSEKEPS